LGQADVVLGGVQVTVFVFLMRACFSGACFVIAFTRETQQAFLEAHVGVRVLRRRVRDGPL
jgi:hypothetical protein